MYIILFDNRVRHSIIRAERSEKVKDKKIKRINVRISLEDYEYLKNFYKWTNRYETRHKTFSDYIRYLLDLGLNDYH
jgi:hypothetical protein